MRGRQWGSPARSELANRVRQRIERWVPSSSGLKAREAVPRAYATCGLGAHILIDVGSCRLVDPHCFGFQTTY
eukprot:7406807-Heterocapsa_arctica.AAC.1